MFFKEIKKLFILGILLLMLFGLFEFVCLFFVPITEGNHLPDSIIGKRLIPNQNKNIGTILEPIYLKTNSLGYHDIEHSKEKNNDTFRIAFLGDSFLEAVDFEIEEIVFKQVEFMLNEKNLFEDIETLSFGVSGQSNAQELIQLKQEVLDYNPDLVILIFQNTDVVDNSLELSCYKYRPYYFLNENNELELKPINKKDYITDKIRRYFFTYSRGLTFLYKSKVQISKYYSSQSRYDNQTKIPFYLNTNVSNKLKGAWDVTEKLLEEMKIISQSNNASFIMFSTTSDFVIKSKNKTLMNDKNVYDLYFLEKQLKNISVRQNISFYPLIYDFEEKYNKTGVELNKYKNDHWNKEGNRFAAQIISNKIIEGGYLQ